MDKIERLAIHVGTVVTDRTVSVFRILPDEKAVLTIAEVIITGIAAQAAGAIGKQRGETRDSVKGDAKQKEMILEVIDRVRAQFVEMMDAAEAEAA